MSAARRRGAYQIDSVHLALMAHRRGEASRMHAEPAMSAKRLDQIADAWREAETTEAEELARLEAR